MSSDRGPLYDTCIIIRAHYGGCISKGPLISRKEGRVDG